MAPWGEEGAAAKALQQACPDAAREGWRRLAGAVRARIDPTLAPIHRDWARLWDAQIESAFEFRAIVVPQRELREERLARLVGGSRVSSAWSEAHKIRELGEAIPPDHHPGYAQDNAGRWQAQMEISAAC